MAEETGRPGKKRIRWPISRVSPPGGTETLPGAGMKPAPGGEPWWQEIRPRIFLVALFLTLLLGLALQYRVTDADFWWHLRTGQWILENRAIPYTDPYSFTAEGQPWIAHSWLAEVGMYLLYRYIGPFTLPLLRALLEVATFGLLLKMFWERWPRLWGNLLLLLVVFFATARFWLERPNTLSLAFSPLLLYLWQRYKWNGRAPLWLLPLLMAFWANLHSGFIYGLFLLGMLFLGELLAGRFFPDPLPLERRRWLRFGFFSLLAALAALLNPYGPRLLLYPFTYYFGGITLHTGFVAEWLSPNFHEFSNLLFALLILAMIGALAWRRSGPGPAETLTLLLFLGLALSSIRAAGVAIPMLAWSLSGILGQGVAPRPMVLRRGAWPRPGKGLLWAWYGGTLLLLLLLWAAIGYDFVAWGQKSGFVNEEAYPRQAVSALAEALSPSSHFFNSYNWGGYLIWRLYPQHRVFIDGRADLYGDTLFRDYMAVWRTAPNWAQVLEKYQVEAVLCERQGPLATVLAESRSWQRVYQDDLAVVFRRESPTAGEMKWKPR